jgi:hypothetical protein
MQKAKFFSTKLKNSITVKSQRWCTRDKKK